MLKDRNWKEHPNSVVTFGLVHVLPDEKYSLPYESIKNLEDPIQLNMQ